VRIWRFIDDGTGTAARNMAVDEALLRTFAGDGTPILRLYGWSEPALSFGRFTDPYRVVDPRRTEAEGVACVRRITGGGVLVHGGDLSYALIVPRAFVREHGAKNAYGLLSGFLPRFYRSFGYDAAFAGETGVPAVRSDACLAGTERYDLLIGGRKIGGNAQYHTAHALLQHGSIPLRLERERFEPLFREDSGLRNAADLPEADFETAKARLLEAFAAHFGAELRPEPLDGARRESAERLRREKYTQKEWTFDGRLPALPA